MFNFLLAEEAATGTNKNSWIMWVVIAVVLVLMIVLTIVPQKKRQKQQQNMMNSLTVGTKIMTIGRMVGKITQVNADNTLIVNVGTESNPTLIVIDRQAVGLVLENVAAPVVTSPVEETPASDAAADDHDPLIDDAKYDTVDETFADDNRFDAPDDTFGDKE